MAKNPRQVGNAYENQFCRIAEDHGYATFCARGSRGQSDVLCFQDENTCGTFQDAYKDNPLPPLAVKIGTAKKPIKTTLQELTVSRRPIGSLCLVARRTKTKTGRTKWLYHTAAGKFLTLREAIETR